MMFCADRRSRLPGLAGAWSVVLATAALVGGASAGEPYATTSPGKPGTGGLVPTLQGSGTAVPGSPDNAVALSDALPGSAATLVVGFQELAAPFKGGVLGPVPDLLVPGLPVDAQGGLQLAFALTPAALAGQQLWTQAWIADPGASFGLAASNTLRLTVQLSGGLFPWRHHGLTGQDARQAVTLDVDRDGQDDLLVIGQASDSLDLLLGRGDGTFEAPLAIPVGAGPRRLAVARLDIDPLDDVLVSYDGESYVTALFGQLDGTLGERLDLGVDAPAVAARAGDMDGNGLPDLVAATGDNAVVRLATGPRTFAAPTAWTAAASMTDMELADVDGDGRLDVLACGTQFDELSVSLGLPGGELDEPTSFPAGPDPFELLLADLDGDGVDDVVTAHGGGSAVSVLPGLGAGSFGVAGTVATVPGPAAIALVDLDADGALDLVSVGGRRLGRAAGLGDGSFAPMTEVTIAAASGALAAGHWDADGLPDLAVGHPADVSLVIGEDLAALTSLSTEASSAAALRVGDIDGDGVPDAVELVQGLLDDRFDVRLGDGAGGFGAAVTTELFEDARDFVMADVDDDGRDDVVVVLGGGAVASPGTRLLLGQADGTLATAGTAQDLVYGALAVADLDQDGVLDLLNLGPELKIALRGDTPMVLTEPLAGDRLAVGDHDGDGLVDVAITGAGVDVQVAPGLGDGSFGAPVVQLGALGLELLFADLDGDGDDELVTRTLGGVFVLDEGAPAVGPLDLGTTAWALAVGDVDGDGSVDLAASAGADRLLLAPGRGDGSLGDVVPYSSAVGLASLHLADLDTDGDLDVVGLGPDGRTVLPNRCVAGP